MTKKKKSSANKLAEINKSRSLFGAYNDPTLKEESYYATNYAKEHMNLVNRDTVRKIYAEESAKAKATLDAELGMSEKEYKEMVKIFGKAQSAFTPQLLEFKETYGITKDIGKTALAIKEGRINGSDISKAIKDFEYVVYKLMNTIVVGSGLKGIDFSKVDIKEGVSQADVKKMLSDLDNMYSWLKDDTKGAATTLKRLFENYDTFIDAYNRGVESNSVWETSKKLTPLSEKSAGGIRQSTIKSLQSIQGGVAEHVMASEIAKEMSKIEEMLGKMVSVKGGEISNKKRMGKADISVPFRKEGGNIVNVNVSAKSEFLIKNSKTKIPFEGGGKDTKSYFSRYGLADLYEPYTILSHYRNIKGSNRSMNSSLYSISSLIGARYALEALGVNSKTHYLFFGNKIIPTYKLLEEMSGASFELHIGANGNIYHKYQGKFNQEIAYKEYVDYKKSSQPSWSSYQGYIQQRSNTVDRTQFVLAYRK